MKDRNDLCPVAPNRLYIPFCISLVPGLLVSRSNKATGCTHTHLPCSKDSQHTCTRTKQQRLMHHVLRCPHKMVSQLMKLQTTMLNTLVFILTPSTTFSDINCIYTHGQNLAVCTDEVFFFILLFFYCKNE